MMKLWTPLIKEASDATFLLATFFCGLHVTNAYLCSFALTQGPSMLPTFNVTGNLVVLERLSTRFGKLGPGDVVLVRSPDNPRKIIAKRVVGVEGDTVSYALNPRKSDDVKSLKVPQGHVWIEGDYKYNTNDSRKFGPVPYGLIQGRVFCKVWPFDEFGLVGKSS